MAQILQLAHLVEDHRVAHVNVGGGRVQAQLDAQRRAGGFGADQLPDPLGFGDQFIAATQADGQRLAHPVGDS